ncbi:hypothetical protein, conserved [Eimeria acervulina]|uniref:Uncharacterized protein n=1 Tax=Eimeria acervulina TaxID=5801 RepID=U6GY73_EIMAC|nr:hypothetical protein, conserved [Eimeria acervulina]CDI84527.1 hypothetical protein, conserved [Eimeria acervulina]
MDAGLSSFPELPPMEPQVASEDWRSFLGKNSAKRQPHINSSRPNIEETADLSTVRYLKRARAPWTSLRPTIAVLVGVSLLFATLCGGGGRIRSGRTVRRLADGERGEAPSSGRNPLFDEDQWIALSAEELAVLCSQLGEWEPSFAPHGSSSPSVRLPEVASTSSGRTSQHILQTQSGSFTSPGPSRLLGGPSRLPAALDLSSTPAHSSSHNGKHPFVRAPALMQGMDMDDLQATVSHPWSGNEPIARLLRTVRRVFLKEVLDVADAKELLSAALELYKRGSSPSEDEVLSIKRKLFCLEFSPRCFLRESWEVWRQDDRNFPGGR